MAVTVETVPTGPSPGAVVAVDPRDDPRWVPGSLFTSPRWIRAVCGTYGFTPTARVVLDPDGHTRAGVAWALVDDLRGTRRVALPFSDRADPPGCDDASWSVLRRAIEGDVPLTLRCLEGHPAARDPSLRRIGEAAWHETALAGDAGDVYARLDGRVRRALRYAAREGLEVEVGGALDDLHRVHGLHVELRKHKYGMLAPPRELFDRLREEFGPDLVTATAWRHGELAAGAVFLVHEGVLYYKFGASRAEHLWCRPNESLAWAVICWALARGDVGAVDWGVSDLDQPGLLQYKRKWATTESRVVTVRTAAPVAEPVGPVLADLTALFTRDDVPIEVTAAAGALLYRYFC